MPGPAGRSVPLEGAPDGLAGVLVEPWLGAGEEAAGAVSGAVVVEVVFGSFIEAITFGDTDCHHRSEWCHGGMLWVAIRFLF
jgi:hypothetical protein